MRYLIGYIILISLLPGCYSYHASYQVVLDTVESPKSFKQQFGEKKLVTFDKGNFSNSFDDSLIHIVWNLNSSTFNFSLTNNSNNSIKVLWDDAAYVDESGLNKRISHRGVNYMDISKSQPNTTVVRGSILEDSVIPIENEHFIRGSKPLFKEAVLNKQDAITLNDRYIGKRVKILLPLKIEETINEYLFTFRIVEVLVNGKPIEEMESSDTRRPSNDDLYY